MSTTELKTVLTAEDRTTEAFRPHGARRPAEAVEKINGGFEKMEKALDAAFLGISVAAVGEFFARLVEGADEIDRLAVKAGIAGSSMAAFAYAAKMSDVDVSALSASLAKMQKATVDAANGSKEAQQAFAGIRHQVLGIPEAQARRPVCGYRRGNLAHRRPGKTGRGRDVHFRQDWSRSAPDAEKRRGGD
jgi:hypothetical protein